MIVEAKQKYRGVLCLHCHQPISLSSSTAANEGGFGEQPTSGGDELIVRSLSVRSFTERSFAMRCRACEGEGLYTGSDVITCDGTPRTRISRARKRPTKWLEERTRSLSDLTKPPLKA
jgi:hypothetical protein